MIFVIFSVQEHSTKLNSFVLLLFSADTEAFMPGEVYLFFHFISFFFLNTSTSFVHFCSLTLFFKNEKALNMEHCRRCSFPPLFCGVFFLFFFVKIQSSHLAFDLSWQALNSSTRLCTFRHMEKFKSFFWCLAGIQHAHARPDLINIHSDRQVGKHSETLLKRMRLMSFYLLFYLAVINQVSRIDFTDLFYKSNKR